MTDIGPHLVFHIQQHEVRIGIWCDDCMFSERFEVDYTIGVGDDAGPVQTMRRCLRCQPVEEEDVD